MVWIDRPRSIVSAVLVLSMAASVSTTAADPDLGSFETSYGPKVRPLLDRYCKK